MRKLFLLAVAVCLFAPIGMAVDKDSAANINKHSGGVAPSVDNRGLGDALWAIDVEAAVGDNLCLGTEFDGTNYWVTGAGGFATPYIAEIAPDGSLVNQFPQPPGNIGGWGWRDLAYDGQFLYAGSDTDQANQIVQIDPADGQKTGTAYGPFPVNPCRALAYDPADDSFWTASFSSSLYHCFKDGTSDTLANPGFAMYGAAAETLAATKIWWWSQDGNGCLANEMLTDGSFTGETFDGDTSFFGGGIAGGAGAYDVGGGVWNLVGLAQGSPDHIVGYDLDTVALPLEASATEVSAWLGGQVNFFLNAGPDYAGETYLLLGGLSGNSPGLTLPGGQVLPVNYDFFSFLVILLATSGSPLLDGFIGELDQDGMAEATLDLPGHCQLFEDVMSTWAFATAQPYTFVSNYVEVLILGAPPVPDEYFYDDGSTENLLGYFSGGEMCWANYFDTVSGAENLTEVATIWGSTTYPGYGPGNGAAGMVYIWDDTNGDKQLFDGDALLFSGGVTTDEYDNDTHVYYSLGGTVTVGSGFFVGFSLNSVPGQYVIPMDESQNPTNGNTWFIGKIAGVIDPINLSTNDDLQPMNTMGFDCYCPSRAK